MFLGCSPLEFGRHSWAYVAVHLGLYSTVSLRRSQETHNVLDQIIAYYLYYYIVYGNRAEDFI